MGLPPPKLRELTSMNSGTCSAASTTPKEIWEIAVPSRNSLYWSIVIPYLLSASDKKFAYCLKQLTGSGENLTKTRNMRKEFRNFNPFKNRFVLFHCKSITEVFRSFKKNLNRKSTAIKSKDDVLNYEIKLKTAAQLLNVIFEVYFPDEPNQEILTYEASAKSSDLKSRIILFQYKDQPHKKRKENINIFYFGMNVQHAYPLKLDALAHVMKKTKISGENIKHIKQLVEQENNNELNFLSSILKSEWVSTLPYLFKSPYFVLKLHEAGFETDPTEVEAKSRSPLYYAAKNANLSYFRILYDYASNCRCLLDKSVRNADETVLDTLKKLKTVLEDDMQQIELVGIESDIEQRALNILSQYFHFADYQLQIATEIRSLKLSQGKESEFNLRKKIVKSILEHYLRLFQRKLPNDASKDIYLSDISKTLDNYFPLSEFYENTDNFAYTLFFDNFYLLKKNLGVKFESITSTIEMKMFIKILSSKHFSESEPVHYKTACEKNRNLLAYIPLYHRRVLADEVEIFINYLKSDENSQKIKDILRKKNVLGSYCPEIVDELMLMKLQKYIDTSLDVSPLKDGIKAVLTIEKALQVVGESIKPTSSENRISSCLLRSCLPHTLQEKLISIRNTLSHYRNCTIEGKLLLEKKLEFWDNVKGEISKIRDAFKIVCKTQSHRTMEFLMNSVMAELTEEKLKQELIETFNKKLHNEAEEEMGKNIRFHAEYSDLLLSVINDLQKGIKDISGTSAAPDRSEKDHKNVILASLKAVEFLMNYILKQTDNKDYNILLMDVQKLIQTYQVDDSLLDESYLNDLNLLILKCKEKLSENVAKFESYPAIESIYSKLLRSQFTTEDQDQIIKAINEAYEESEEAKDKLKECIKNSFSLTEEEIEKLLIKVILKGNLSTLRDSLKKSNVEDVLMQHSVSKETLVNDAKEMMEENSVKTCSAKTVFTKLAFQKYLTKEIYTKVNLPPILCKKLEEFLMRKIKYLLNRLKTLKRILIEEDEEIKRAWEWGKSDAMKYHMQFLMRQRYMREMTFCAPLETVVFDCFNILKRKNFEELLEKPDKLFTGVNLRNVISHMSIFHAIGGMLDEDDFPSEMVKKMIELIEESETIESISKLFKKADTLEEDRFKELIDKCDSNEELIKKIKKSSIKRDWQNYLFLFPWI